MIKVQWGANENLLEGWINFRNEHDGDIRKPLQFADNSVDFVFTEHCQEHVTHQEAYRFLKEVYRILKPSGVYRVIVPDVKSIWEKCDDDYLNFIDGSMEEWWQHAGHSPPDHPCSRQTAFETILCCHGHRAAYTPDLLLTFLRAAGFQAEQVLYGKSVYPELDGTDSHWKMMGRARCELESVVAEGTKPA